MSAAINIARARVRAFNEVALDGSPVIETPPRLPKRDFKFYGGARELHESVEPRVMIHGPAETGKTLAALALLDRFCWTYPKIQAAIVRKSYSAMPGTVLQTYEKRVLRMEDGLSPEGVKKFGSNFPQLYDYPNGSRVWIGGLDKPGKVLSSERDVVVVNQAEELSKNDWEILSTRTTGRAGVMSPARLIGECNPASSTHWIQQLAAEGTLRMIKSRHEDNPTLFNPTTGEITTQGKISLAALDSITGVRHKRLRLGLWVAAEGVVYDMYEPEVHIVDEPLSPIKRYAAGVDWGFTNPGVIQVWGEDGDGRAYRVEEIYRSQKLVAASTSEDSWWINQALRLYEKYKIEIFACDPSEPQNIELFERAGLPCVKAFNSITLGIQNVESRMKVQADGHPRLMILRGSKPEPDPILAAKHLPVCLEDELEVYAWSTATDKAVKENPIDKDNHACFAAGTLITTLSGYTPIEQVEVGEFVLTRKGFRRVLAAGCTSEAAPVVDSLCSDGRVLEVTPNHPLWVKDKGFLAVSDIPLSSVLFDESEVLGWKSRYCLQGSTALLTAGTVSKEAKVPVYNLHIEEEHEYYANGVLVSNCDTMRYCLAFFDELEPENEFMFA